MMKLQKKKFTSRRVLLKKIRPKICIGDILEHLDSFRYAPHTMLFHCDLKWKITIVVLDKPMPHTDEHTKAEEEVSSGEREREK